MVSDIESGAEVTQAYPFEVSVNNPEAVKVTHARSDPRQLWTTKSTEDGIRKSTGGLTSCKRFALGLDLVYSITFPFCIQAEAMRKE